MDRSQPREAPQLDQPEEQKTRKSEPKSSILPNDWCRLCRLVGTSQLRSERCCDMLIVLSWFGSIIVSLMNFSQQSGTESHNLVLVTFSTEIRTDIFRKCHFRIKRMLCIRWTLIETRNYVQAQESYRKLRIYDSSWQHDIIKTKLGFEVEKAASKIFTCVALTCNNVARFLTAHSNQNGDLLSEMSCRNYASNWITSTEQRREKSIKKNWTGRFENVPC